MNHLIISREFPPSTYPRGGIGTYVEHIARLLAERGEVVHVIGEQWDGAPLAREVRLDGRLIIHRVPLGRPLPAGDGRRDLAGQAAVLDAMAASEFPAQSFSWQASLLAESLVESAAIDVIEGQDYEAPLYYLLLRRALGQGPRRCPPCFVHLHSPWEFVCQSNDWGLASDYDVTIKRLEDYAIAAADARLCPSRYLAAQIESHYGLDPGSIERIPYPIGDTPLIERASETWRTGTVCYFGRLEPRKGVLEWVHAAVELAAERPGLQFEFIGADTSLTGDRGSSVRAAIEAVVPSALKGSFTFDGPQPRAALWSRLSQAQLVVVPSRWENFPLTCVEAMSSGVPVVASPNGGMVEMIEEGRTGWVADSGSSADLLRAARRALDTPPDERARMGHAASAAIRTICDNAHTIDRHLEFRARLVAGGAARSLHVPALPPWTPPLAAPDQHDPRKPLRVSLGMAPGTPPRAGIGLIVIVDEPGNFDESAASIQDQTRSPHGVIVMADDSLAGALAAKVRSFGWQMAPHSFTLAELETRNVFATVLGVAVIRSSSRLEPAFVESAEAVLVRQAEVGVVSSWTQSQGRANAVTLRPCPALPYQWLWDDTSACTVFRAEALRQIDAVRAIPAHSLPIDEIAVAVLAEGWLAVTHPSVLSRRADDPARASESSEQDARRELRSATIAAHPETLADEGPLLMQLVQVRQPENATSPLRQIGRGALTPDTILKLPLADQLRLVLRAVRNPRYAGSWLAWQGRRWWRP